VRLVVRPVLLVAQPVVQEPVVPEPAALARVAAVAALSKV
jgi:hypothetical protein